MMRMKNNLIGLFLMLLSTIHNAHSGDSGDKILDIPKSVIVNNFQIFPGPETIKMVGAVIKYKTVRYLLILE